jgi:hypothetical protein
MKITPAHIILPLVALGLGCLLLYQGLWSGWGSVWASGGAFFASIGVGTTLLNLSYRVPGRPGELLRSRQVGIIIMAVPIFFLVVTVLLGIFD